MGELHTVTDINPYSFTVIKDPLADIGTSMVARDTLVVDTVLFVVGMDISVVDIDILMTDKDTLVVGMVTSTMDINISVADIDPYMAEINKLEGDIGISIVDRNTTAADTEEEAIEAATIADKKYGYL